MSVVVPPISLTSASCAPVIHCAPTIEAAGPLKIVSIGFSRACAEEISAPSPRTTISGAVIPRSRSPSSARTISLSIIPISRAFRSAVSARFGPLSFADSWCDAETGAPVASRIISIARSSWAGFLVANLLATAKADTPETVSNHAESSTSSSVCAWPPAWS